MQKNNKIIPTLTKDRQLSLIFIVWHFETVVAQKDSKRGLQMCGLFYWEEAQVNIWTQFYSVQKTFYTKALHHVFCLKTASHAHIVDSY